MAYPQLARRRRAFETLPNGETVDEAVMRLSRNPAVVPVNDPPLTRPRRVMPPVVTEEPEIAGQYTPLQLVRRPRLEPVAEPVINNVEPIRRPIQPVLEPRAVMVNSEPVVQPAPNSNLPQAAQGIFSRIRNRPIEGYGATPVMPPDVARGERPVMTGDSATDEQMLQDYRPKDHNGRLKSFGLGLLRGYGQGGLGGALFGGISHLAKPDLDEKYQQAVDLQRLGGINDRRLGQQKVMSDLETDRTLNAQRRAQIDQLPDKADQARERIKLQKRGQLLRQLTDMKVYKPGQNPAFDAQLQSADIQADAFDETQGNERPIWIKGQLHTINRSGQLSPVIRDGQVITDPSKIPIEEGGLWVTPGTALTARATADNRNYQRGRDAQSDAEKAAEVESTNTTVNQHVTELKRQQEEAYAVANDPKRQDWERADARKRAERLMETIRQEELRRKPVPRVQFTRSTQGQTPSAPAQGSYAGRSIKRANVAAWGKDRGLSEADALKELERLQVKVN